MKKNLEEYLSSNNLEIHTPHIIDIVVRHSNTKSVLIRNESKSIKRKRTKEILHENKFFIIVKDFHTKDKCDIWVLKLKRKIWLGKDNFSELKEFIECYDGYYSGFSGGFIFKSMPVENILEEVTELINNLL